MTLHRPRNTTLWLAFLLMAGLSLWRAADFRQAVSTRGIGMRTDSVAYIWSARSLAAGVGLGRLDGYGDLRPMTHWPPLYPLALTLPALAGVDPLDSARWLNLLLAAANPLLAGLLVYRLTRSALAALVVHLTLIFSPALVFTHLFAMSEPLYLFLTLAALCLLYEWIRASRRWVLFGLGACLGLALLTRYAGLGLALAAGTSLLLLGRGSLRKRLLAALTLAGLTAVPMLAWLARNALVAGTATNRSLEWFPLNPGEAANFAALANEWVLPFGARLAPDPFKWAAAAAALLLVAWTISQRARSAGILKGENAAGKTAGGNARSQLPAREPAPLHGAQGVAALIAPLLLHLLFYSAMLLISRLLFDPAIPLDEQRIWLPAYVNLILLGGLALARIIRRLADAPPVVLLPAALALAWAAGALLQGYSGQTRLLLDSHRHYGSGLEHIDWVQSPLLLALRDLPREPITYTNNIEMLYYHTGRHSFLLDSPDPAVFERLRADLPDRGVLIVLYHPPSGLVDAIEISIPELDVAYHGADGTIFIAD